MFFNAVEYMLTCLAVFLVTSPIEIHDELFMGLFSALQNCIMQGS